MVEVRFPVRDVEGESVAEVFVREQDGRYFIERTTFINSFSKEVSQAAALGIRLSALNGDWKALNSLDPEFLPWYCPDCGQNYAEKRWQVHPRYDEDQWLDSYRGVCPKGHERMLAD